MGPPLAVWPAKNVGLRGVGFNAAAYGLGMSSLPAVDFVIAGSFTGRFAGRGVAGRVDKKNWTV